MINKLKSRKFWALLAAVLIPILNTVVGEPLDSKALIAAVMACIGYMFAEAQTDKTRARANGGNNSIIDVMKAVKAAGFELKQPRKTPTRQPKKPKEDKPQSEDAPKNTGRWTPNEETE